ncbi:MAG: hypothetical protein V3R46_00145 [Thermoplasmata archaeon]
MEEEPQEQDPSTNARVARRAIWATIIAIVASSLWLAGILVFWAFLSSGFTLFQNIIVLVASLVITGGIIGAAFMSVAFLEHPKWRRI